MQRSQIRELYYITRIENVRSICIRGIYCHRRAGDVAHTSFAMDSVQQIREQTRVYGRSIHDYANLYINPRNVTLYKQREEVGSLCVLRVSTDLLDLPGVCIADRNAASNDARFATGPQALDILAEKIVNAAHWSYPHDPERSRQYRQGMCAEVLVPDSVPGAYVVGAYVVGILPQVRLLFTVPRLRVKRNPVLFFMKDRH